MKSLLQKFQCYKPSKMSLKSSCRENNLKISYLNMFSIRKAKKIILKLENMYVHTQQRYRQNLKPLRCNWFQNQLKVFQFTLLFLSTFKGKKIMQFSQQDWNQLGLTFRGKQMAELQYQAMNFVADKNILKKRWDLQQDKLLKNFINQQKQQINWNKIAISLFFQSKKNYYRTGKQCKQRWLNHLDPQIKHGNWTIEQDKLLVQEVRKNGKKWAFITKQFGYNRTQHMIKNRYISLLLKYRKKYPDIVEQDHILQQLCRDMFIRSNDDRNDISGKKKKFLSNQKVMNERRGDQMLRSSTFCSGVNKIQKNEQVSQKQQNPTSKSVVNYSTNMIPFLSYYQNYCEGFTYYPLIHNFTSNVTYYGF